MFCGVLWGSLQGQRRVFAMCILSWCQLWCPEWFPLFSPSSLTWVLHFHLASQSGDTTEARSVSDRLPKNRRWNTENCEGWCKLPAQLPSMFLWLSLAPFLPFSPCCIQIHSQFWLLSWYLAVTVLHTGAPNQFLLHKYVSLSTLSIHDPFMSFSACVQSHSLSLSCSKQLLGLTQNCTYPSPPNRHKPTALSLPSCLWSFSRFLTLCTLYTFFVLCWWTFALKGKEDLSLCMKHQGCSEEPLSQTSIPVQRKWDVISLSEIRKAAFLRPLMDLEV